MSRAFYSRDFWSGLLFMAFGIATMLAGRPYEMGTATSMGPGWFPTILAWILTGMGLIVALRSLARNGESIPKGVLRPQLFIIIAILLFAFLVERTGLFIAAALTAAIGSLASREARPLEVLIVAVMVGLACVGIFIYGVGQPIPAWLWNV